MQRQRSTFKFELLYTYDNFTLKIPTDELVVMDVILSGIQFGLLSYDKRQKKK